MSLSAPCLAVRNMLRTSLTNFYDQTAQELEDDDGLVGQVKRRKANVRIMPDHRPSPSAGREFISIYASGWESTGGDQYALHETITITCALTHRYGDVLWDRLGEAAYLMDEDVFVQQYVSIEERLREIVLMIHSDYLAFQTQMLALNQNRLDKALQGSYDKLWFASADATPTIVGPDHFHASDSTKAPSGLMMKANFKGASSLHWMPTLGYTET